MMPRADQIVEDFHRLYINDVFDKSLRVNWLGVEVIKYPTDLIVYQEIIHEIRPNLIVETGTHHGGSAMFFASMLDLIGQGKVISIDVKRRDLPHHPRITYLVGDSTSGDVVTEVASRAEGLACSGDARFPAHEAARRPGDRYLSSLRDEGKLFDRGGHLDIQSERLSAQDCVNEVIPTRGGAPAVSARSAEA